MSSQVRGSAIVAIAVALVCLSLMLNFEVAQARKSCKKTYIVGGAQGWTFGIDINWPGKMIFRAGDTLVFKYPVGAHNVVVVNEDQYQSCNATLSAPRYSTGNDRIKLRKGHNYFICGYPWHCLGGNMRIAVKAI